MSHVIAELYGMDYEDPPPKTMAELEKNLPDGWRVASKLWCGSVRFDYLNTAYIWVGGGYPNRQWVNPEATLKDQATANRALAHLLDVLSGVLV